MRRLFMGLPLVAGLAVSGSASAMVVSAGDPAFDVFWSCGPGAGNCNIPGNTIPPSTESATGVFSNFAFSNGGTTFTMDISITNTTPQGTFSAATWAGIDVTDFGFDTVPDATGISTTSTVFPTAVLEQTLPGFMKVDVCNSSGNSCAGGANGGVFPVGSGGTPTSDAFTLTLTGLPAGSSSIDLGTDVAGGTELFDIKFAGTPGSFEFQNSPGSPPPPDVPEPGTLALLGSFLVVLGIASTRRPSRYAADRLTIA
jgi:hypothetical protein